jgi:hypothetical protein
MTLSIIQFTNRIIKKFRLRRSTTRYYNLYYKDVFNLQRRRYFCYIVKHYGKFRVDIRKTASCMVSCYFYSGYVRISKAEFIREVVTPVVLKKAISTMIDTGVSGEET